MQGSDYNDAPRNLIGISRKMRLPQGWKSDSIKIPSGSKNYWNTRENNLVRLVVLIRAA